MRIINKAESLSEILANGELLLPPPIWEQYSKHGRMNSTYRISDEKKKLRTPNFLEADFCYELLLISKPKILIELRGVISPFSKLIE